MVSRNARNGDSIARRTRLALVLSVVAALIGCATIDETVSRSESSVIYGEDDRLEVFEQVNGSVGQRVAAGTVALVESSRLDLTDPTQVKLTASTLGERLNLCSEEHYRDQPTLAFCSGTLIASDLVLTAGHCVDSALCVSTQIVLGYQMQDASTLAAITPEQVYSCSAVVVRNYDSEIDYAIIRLDRAVTGVELAPVKVGKLPVTVGEGLVFAGYPSGLPEKVADGATVLDARAQELDYFMADLDAFPGNSGGGVYTADSGELTGILVRGPNPGYARLSGETCYRAEQSDAATGTLIESVYVHQAIQAFCAVATDERLCACGNGTCDELGRENTATCSEDCGSRCGDAACNGTEDGNNCYSDCGYCGDGVCDNAEVLRMNCNQDCGCPPGLAPSGTNCVPIPGNVNGDEKVDVADWVALRAIQASGALGRVMNAAADVDCSGAVDGTDIEVLKRFVRGTITSLPCDTVAGLSLGGQHSCALMQSGKVKCWGDNTLGQLGNGTREQYGDDESPWAAPAVELAGPVAALAAGNSHNCALLVDGSVQCWGDGTAGILGYGDEENVGDDELPNNRGVVSLGAKAIAIAAGGSHSCAILEGGAVRCWGSNDFGQLGTGAPGAVGDDELPSSVEPLVFDSPVARLALGFDFSCVLLESGKVYCWGENFLGQLGRGDFSGSDPFEQAVSILPVDIGGNAVEISAGMFNVCARRTDGGVLCWGDNSAGQLGYGHYETVGDDELPVDAGLLPLGSDVKNLAVGDAHVCSLHTDGTVRCWGTSDSGELGYGDPALVAPPLVLSALSAVPVGGLVGTLAVGGRHSCALLATSKLHCWGNNAYGQLGYGHQAAVGVTNTPAIAGDVAMVATSSAEWHFVNSAGLRPELQVSRSPQSEVRIGVDLNARTENAIGRLTAYYDLFVDSDEAVQLTLVDEFTPASKAALRQWESGHYSVTFDYDSSRRDQRRHWPGSSTLERVRLIAAVDSGQQNPYNDYSALDLTRDRHQTPTTRVQVADAAGAVVYGWTRADRSAGTVTN